MHRSSPRWLSVATAALVATAAVGTSAPPVAAADQLRDTGLTTYELRPDRGVVRVTVQYTLTNRAPSKSRSWDCSIRQVDPYGYVYVLRRRCTTRTDYYYDWYEVWVEHDAVKIKAKANRGTISADRRGKSGAWRAVRLRFTPIYYGQTRKITVTYDLPAGGPRSTKERRVGYAYSKFCAVGPGTDTGRMRVVVPAGYEMTLSRSMRSKVSGGRITYDTGQLTKEPWEFVTCLEGRNDSGYATTDVTASDGSTVKVEAWKEDQAWADAVTTSVREDFGKLRALLGEPPVGDDLTVREELAGITRPDRPGSGIHHISEQIASRDAATHDLALLWFPATTLRADWLTEGYAAWAQHETGTSTAACTKPAAGTSGKELDVWVRSPSSQADRDTAAYQRQAACHLISYVADAMGPERMAATLELIRSGRDAWSAPDAPASERSALFHWRTWLDIVTQHGLVPAGADPDPVSDMLVEFGIASEAERLTERREAHDAYGALRVAMGETAALAAVTAPLRTWDFPAAKAAIATAGAAWADMTTIKTLLPDLDTAPAGLELALAAATNQADLDAVAARAATQARLATDAAGALAAVNAPRDPLVSVGLIGAVLPDPEQMIDAVARVDSAVADGHAASVRSTMGSARGAGLLRAVGAASVLAAIAGVGWFLQRRRSRSRT